MLEDRLDIVGMSETGVPGEPVRPDGCLHAGAARR
jgi:hypothetical protein